MKQLLTQYSVGELILIIFMIAIAAKQLLTVIDFFRKRVKGTYDTQTEKENQIKKLEEVNQKQDQQFEMIMGRLQEIQTTFDERVTKHDNDIKKLIQSDRDSIKTEITRQYHHFVETQKWIDDYSLDCLEHLYSHYKDEGGNSFIHTLIEEIRALPKSPQE